MPKPTNDKEIEGATGDASEQSPAVVDAQAVEHTVEEVSEQIDASPKAEADVIAINAVPMAKGLGIKIAPNQNPMRLVEKFFLSRSYRPLSKEQNELVQSIKERYLAGKIKPAGKTEDEILDWEAKKREKTAKELGYLKKFYK